MKLSDLTPQLLDQLEQASTWQPLSAKQEPVSALTEWRVYEVSANGVSTQHLVGYAGYEGRVSSPVVSFDPINRKVVTNSGRVYLLKGGSGMHPDAMYTFNIWKQRFPESTTFTDITGSYA